ncbi:MAG: M48 family metallopeptidase, partial [Gemmatimonadota bacterium]
PLAYGSGSQAERAFGLSTQGSLGWLGDHARRLLFWIPVTAALAAGFLACLARWPRRGWRAGAGAGIVIMIAGVFLAPRIVDPLFHDFTPLSDPALTREIRGLGARAGLDINRVMVMDASRRTSRPNAYVTGIGATRQVVLYDTLLEQTPRGELRVVIAHELAHAARGHVGRGIAWAALGILAAAWALSGLARWQARIDPLIAGPGDPAGLPLLWLAFSLGLFATSPLQSGLSRAMEAEADWAALELTRDPAHYLAMQRRLSRANLEPVAPPGWIVTWLYTHPPIGERLAMASRWRAERARP